MNREVIENVRISQFPRNSGPCNSGTLDRGFDGSNPSQTLLVVQGSVNCLDGDEWFNVGVWI